MPDFLHGVEVVEITGGVRPIQTASTSVIGIVGTAPNADAAAFPVNTPVLVAGSRTEAAKLGDPDLPADGTLPPALDGILDQVGAVVIVVRVEEGADEAETLANVVGGVDGVTGNLEGLHALTGAESVLGKKPRILCAPGWSHQRPGDAANPVVAEAVGIATRLRAVFVADGPNTTDADALTAAGDSGSSRVLLVDPWVLASRAGVPVAEPSSARVAGLIARVDNAEGFWTSPSNNEIFGIVGTARAIPFELGDAASRANLLNEGKVATIVRQDGYRLWGNRSLTSDVQDVFINVRRTRDVMSDSVLRAHLWAVDRGITSGYIEEVEDGVNAFLRQLENLGAISGGRCWADPDLNTPASIQLGQVYFNIDFTPVYPAERITFQTELKNDYLQEVV